jgi:hypothetical protein
MVTAITNVNCICPICGAGSIIEWTKIHYDLYHKQDNGVATAGYSKYSKNTIQKEQDNE